MNLNSKKKQEPMKSYLRIKPVQPPQKNILVKDGDCVRVEKDYYSFDKVFGQMVNNKQVFQSIGEPLIQHSFQGYNSTVLAYGQTFSGKTYTIKGTKDSPGLIPNFIEGLFTKIADRKLVAQVCISYIQIYNENIYDLIGQKDESLEIREDYQKNITISGLKILTVKSVEEALDHFQKGEDRRKYASNNINLQSSRSHTIFKISVEVVQKDYNIVTSQINMVDLAGSEGVSRTKAEGITKKQGENINKSILALCNVIRSMNLKQNYVNFRDSKLTRILQSSLCSNSKSIVICTVNPTQINQQETINTMKFGIDVSNITINVKQNIRRGEGNHQSELDPAHNRSESNLIETESERLELIELRKVIDEVKKVNHEFQISQERLKSRVFQLEFQNQRLIRELNETTREKNESQFKGKFQLSQNPVQIMEQQIKTLKEERKFMKDRNEELEEQIQKLQRNEKTLILKLQKYDRQIASLKQISPAKAKSPIKIIPKPRQTQFCPLTIGRIVNLKSQLIEAKQSLAKANQEIANITEQRNELFEKLQLKEEQDVDRKSSGKKMNVESRELRKLRRHVNKLKKQIRDRYIKQRKLTKIIKERTQQNTRDLEELKYLRERKNEKQPNNDDEDFE